MAYTPQKPQTNLAIQEYYQKLGYKYKQWLPNIQTYDYLTIPGTNLGEKGIVPTCLMPNMPIQEVSLGTTPGKFIEPCFRVAELLLMREVTEQLQYEWKHEEFSYTFVWVRLEYTDGRQVIQWLREDFISKYRGWGIKVEISEHPSTWYRTGYTNTLILDPAGIFAQFTWNRAIELYPEYPKLMQLSSPRCYVYDDEWEYQYFEGSDYPHCYLRKTPGWIRSLKWGAPIYIYHQICYRCLDCPSKLQTGRIKDIGEKITYFEHNELWRWHSWEEPEGVWHWVFRKSTEYDHTDKWHYAIGASLPTYGVGAITRAYRSIDDRRINVVMDIDKIVSGQ